MHRTIEITVPSGEADAVAEDLARMEHVVGVTLHRGASVKPPGDVVTVHVLNKGADDVLRCADAVRARGPVSIVTAEVASFIDPEHAKAVDDDVDEAVWEEMESGLRHQGRITPNFLILMGLGGALATAGLVSEPVPQAITIVAASVIAPGFEPLAKIPLGLVLRRASPFWRGVVSALAGYAVLVAVAALMFGVLRLTDQTTVEGFVANHEVQRLSHLTFKDFLVSACAAVAGVTMVAAFRRSVIAGPLIALVLIPAAAMVGAALAAGRVELAGAALRRLGLDTLLVVLAGIAVFGLKQALTHRRRPIV